MPRDLAKPLSVSLALVVSLAVPGFGQSPPVAVDDLYTTAFEDTLSVDPPGVLANDFDPDFDPLTAELVQDPNHGTLRFDPDGGFEYEPDGGFTGVDTFGYVAIAADGSDMATVTIEVGLGGGGVDLYTDEALFLADLAALGLTRIREGFEDGVTWGGVRSDIVKGNHTAPEKTRLGITWTTNNDTSEVTTSEGAARSGQWGFYSLPHGDFANGVGCNLPGNCGDGWISTGAWPLYAAGAWVRTNTPPAKVAIILDGDRANPIDFGDPVLTGYNFYGVIAADGFTSVEFREMEGKAEDQKFIFGDGVSFGVAPGLHLAAKGVCPGDAVVDFVGGAPGGASPCWPPLRRARRSCPAGRAPGW